MVGGQVHADLDFRSQVVVAVGEPVAELAHQADQVGQGPLEPALRQLHDHIHPAQSGVGDEGFGCLDDQRRHPGLHDGGSEVDRDDGPLAGQVHSAEPGLPAAHLGEAEVVPCIEAIADIEPASRVTHRAGQAPDGDRQRRLECCRAARDAAVGGFEAEQAGEASGDPDGATPVPAGGDGQQTAGHSRGRAARGAARGPVGVPRVAGDAVELGGRAVDAPELGRRGLASQNCARSPQPGDVSGVVLRYPVGKDERGLGVGPSLHGLELLDPDGHAPERQGDVGGRGLGPAGDGPQGKRQRGEGGGFHGRGSDRAGGVGIAPVVSASRR